MAPTWAQSMSTNSMATVGRLARSRAVEAKPAVSIQLRLVYLIWFLVIFEPQNQLSNEIGLQVPLLPFYGLLLLFVLMNGSHRGWYPLFLLFVIAVAVMVPFADNNAFAWSIARILMLRYLLAVGTLQFVKKAAQLMPILFMLVLQFAWWGVNSGTSGVVYWHSAYANSDGYGLVMVIGLGLCYHFATGTPSRRLRLYGYAMAAFCVVAVVASFARGAFLAACALSGMMWLRTPGKRVMTAVLVVALAVTVISSRVLFPDGSFWAEMQSAFTEGIEEGTTGNDRWELWKTSVRVFRGSPVFGVGAGNFGVVASRITQIGDIGSVYADNPRMLYQRSLHSIYFQSLSEYGIVGCALLLALLVDFWRRNLDLRKPSAVRAWAAEVPKHPDLKSLALALEAAMVAYLLTGFFYDQLNGLWLYTLLTLNMALHLLAKQNSDSAGVVRSFRPRISNLGQPHPSPAASPPTPKEGHG